MVTTSTTRLCFCITVVKYGWNPFVLDDFLRGVLRTPHESDPSLSCGVNPFEHLDVAQRVDKLLFLYTNIRLRHQRNKVPSHLLRD